MDVIQYLVKMCVYSLLCTLLRNHLVNYVAQGSKNFQKIYQKFKNSRRQKGDMQQGLCWGPKNIRY
jgi:hypothetical protein